MNFYIEDMVHDGTLEKLMNDHDLSQATRESCDADTESTDGTNRRRHLKSTSNNAGPSEPDDSGGQFFSLNESLTLEQMAGTFLIHVVLSAFAIVVGLFSCYERKHNIGRHNNKTHRTRNSTSQEVFSQPNSMELSVQTQIDWLRSSHQEMQSSQKELQSEVFSQPKSMELSVQTQINWLRSSHREIQSSQKELQSSQKEATRQMDAMLLMLKNIQDKLDSDDC